MENEIQNHILTPMTIIREYCRLGHKLRNQYNLPVAYPLHEMCINILELPWAKDNGYCFLQEELQLISDELNIDWIEPVHTGTWSKYATVVTLREGDYEIKVDITKDHYLDRRYEERLAHRAKMQERKDNAYPQVA